MGLGGIQSDGREGVLSVIPEEDRAGARGDFALEERGVDGPAGQTHSWDVVAEIIRKEVGNSE